MSRKGAKTAKENHIGSIQLGDLEGIYFLSAGDVKKKFVVQH